MKQSDQLVFIFLIIKWLLLLACYPFEGQDPFIVKEMPDVFFVSNQQSFQTSLKINSSGNLIYIK